MIRIILLLFCTSASINLSAQQLIQGKVVDAVSRQPLASASITDAASGRLQAVTDASGHFLVRAAGLPLSLTVSYVGYAPRQLQVGNAGALQVALQPDALRLADVSLQAGGIGRFHTATKVDLALRPVRSTQELLQTVPGLIVAQHAGGGKAEQIFLRGFDADHGTDVAVSVDGIPVNMVSHAHGQGYADAHFIIPETVNNIDYGTGPYYAGQGNLNTAGYVALATHQSIDRSRVQVEAGQFDTYRALAMVDLLPRNKEKQTAYLAGEYLFTNGPTAAPQDFHRLNLFGKYHRNLSERTELTLTGSAFSSRWDASGQIPLRAVRAGLIGRFGAIDPTEGGETQRYNALVKAVHRFAGGSSWEHQAYATRYHFDLYSNFTFFLNDPVNGDGIWQSERRNLYGYHTRFRHGWGLGRQWVESAWGAGFRADRANDSRLARQVRRQPGADIAFGDIRERNLFLYTDQQWRSGRWTANAALRLDHFRFNYIDRLNSVEYTPESAAILSPKLNLEYAASRKAQVYLKLGRGFHSNDTRVVVVEGGRETLPAAYGADLGVTLKPSNKLMLQAALWYLRLEQEFVYVGDEGVVEPGGRTERKGVELSGRYQISPALFARLSLHATEPRLLDEPKGADAIPLAPRFTSTGGIFYKKNLGWNGSLTWRQVADRPAIEDGSVTAEGYFILDGAVNFTTRRWEAGLVLENIGNAEWNEAQFATESRLRTEADPVNELHFTPGYPFFARLRLAVFF